MARIVTKAEVSRNFINCVFIFLIQMILSFSILIEYFRSLQKADSSQFIESFVQVLIVRVMCAVALHLQI